MHPDDWVLWQAKDGALVFHDLSTAHASRPPIATGRLAPLHGHPSASPDGSWLVLAHDLGVLTVWVTASLSSGAPPKQLKQLGGIMLSFSDSYFTPDSTRLLGSAYGTEAIKMWETRSFHELLTLQADGTHFHNLGLSSDGMLLGALNGQGRLRLWHAPSWQEIEAQETRPGFRAPPLRPRSREPR